MAAAADVGMHVNGVCACVCLRLCDYAHSAGLWREVVIRQTKNRNDAGNTHAVLFLQSRCGGESARGCDAK